MDFGTDPYFLKATSHREDRLSKDLDRAISEELTSRQREMINMYYIQQMTMRSIADSLGLNVSTVSRTIERGKKRIKKCIRYGSGELLMSTIDD